MNKSQADDFINLLDGYVDTCITDRNMRDPSRRETRRQYADMLKDALVKYTEPEPTVKAATNDNASLHSELVEAIDNHQKLNSGFSREKLNKVVDRLKPTVKAVEPLLHSIAPSGPNSIFSPGNPALVTKDGDEFGEGDTATLYQVSLETGVTKPITGTMTADGWLVQKHNGHTFNSRVNSLYASHLAAWDAHKTHRANGGPFDPHGNAEQAVNTKPTFNTKDMQAVKVGQYYALWHVSDLTLEITKLNGRVDMKGNLFDLAGDEDSDTPMTFPINELYFWRVNCLKDELAAQSTSTVVEVEYSDNAEMEVETSPEYD